MIVVSNGLQAITNNQFVEPRPLIEIMLLLIPQIQKTGFEFFRDIPSFILGIGVVFLMLGYGNAIRHKAWPLVWLLPSMLLGISAVIVFQRVLPYPRTLMVFLPVVFILISQGFYDLFRKVPVYLRKMAQIGLIGLAIIQIVYLMKYDIITQYPDTSAFQAAPLVVQTLKPILHPNDRLRVGRNANESINFYFWYYQVPYPTGNGASNNNTYIVFKPSEQSLSDFTDQAVRLLLESENMQLYQLEK